MPDIVSAPPSVDYGIDDAGVDVDEEEYGGVIDRGLQVQINDFYYDQQTGGSLPSVSSFSPSPFPDPDSAVASNGHDFPSSIIPLLL